MLENQQTLDPANFTWPVIPFPALVGAVGAVMLASIILVAARYFDRTGGLLTLSIMILVAFIQVTFVSMIYTVPQTPITEILIGALSTSVGAIVAYWMSHRSDGRHE